jgi:hypothetical protein
MAFVDEVLLPSLIGVGSVASPQFGAAAGIGLSALDQYQQNQKKRQDAQRFSAYIDGAPFADGDRAYMKSMMQIGQTDEAMSYARDMLKDAEKRRREQQQKMRYGAGDIPSLMGLASQLPAGSSMSVPFENGANINLAGPARPKDERPERKAYTDIENGRKIEVIKEQQADGSWRDIFREDVGPAPREPREPEGPQVDLTQLAMRANNMRTGNPKADAISQEAAKKLIVDIQMNKQIGQEKPGLGGRGATPTRIKGPKTEAGERLRLRYGF